MKPPKPCRWLLATVLSVCLGIPGTRAEVVLPNLSDPVNQALSPEQERLLGEDIMRRLRQSLPLLQDSWSNSYIEQLGQRLVNTLDTPQRYHFFIVDDPQLNAFALPGGFIGLNVGMINAAESEDQLQSVVAHEIAHVQQRHIARAYAAQNNVSMTTLAGVIASLLLASANPQAGQAALTSTLAYGYQSQINFTRENEYEADRVGLRILHQAGYRPNAMSEMFAIMLKRNRLNTSEALEFLRTHPLTSQRVAESQSLANAQAAPSRPASNSDDFALLQARLKAMSQDGVHLASLKGPAEDYYQAQRALNLEQPGKAKAALDRLPKRLSEHPLVQLLEADVASMSGNLKRAEALYEELQAVYPDNYSYLEHHLNALARRGQVQRASERLERALKSHHQYTPRAYRQAAELAGKRGDRLSAMEYQAEYFLQLKDYPRAREQLATALDRLPENSNRHARVRAKLEAIAPELVRLDKP